MTSVLEEERHDLFTAWEDIGERVKELKILVQNSVDFLTHDDIREWKETVENTLEKMKTLENRTLDFMKKPDNMEILERNSEVNTQKRPASLASQPKINNVAIDDYPY